VTTTTTTSSAGRPIAVGLFDLVDEQPVLIGSRCAECGTVNFPVARSCPRCTSEAVERHLLSRSGTLWSWTTQGFRPKTPPYTGPEEFVEYAVGYVELGEEIRVEGLLTESDPAKLKIGLGMRVVSQAVYGPDGTPALTFAFAPEMGA
jgi:uncharacterized protein